MDGPGCDCSPAVTHSNSSNEQSRGSPPYRRGSRNSLPSTTRQDPLQLGRQSEPCEQTQIEETRHVRDPGLGDIENVQLESAVNTIGLAHVEAERRLTVRSGRK